jgi:hypothetical protein
VGYPTFDGDGDPDTNLRAFNVAALSGKNQSSIIGRNGATGAPFYVGMLVRFTVPPGGRLFLGINDTNVTDNSGEYVAAVTVAQP